MHYRTLRLGRPHPEIWRHGTSVLRLPFDESDTVDPFLTGSGRIGWHTVRTKRGTLHA
jgi:hypothetical protein